MYASQAVGVLLSSWQWVVVAALLVTGGYVMVNYQNSLFQTIDVSWTAFYSVAVTPIRTLANLAFLILEILVGIVNFTSQYLGTVMRRSASQLVHADGYNHSTFYDVFQNVALSMSNGAYAVTAWVYELNSIQRGVRFVADSSTSDSTGYGLDETSTTFYDQGLPGTWAGHFELSNVPVLNLTIVVAPIRIATYDLLTRIKGTCPAENGLIDIITKNVVDPHTTAIDTLVSCGVNAIFALPEAFMMSMIVYSKKGKYFPPNVDAYFNALVCALGSAKDIGNALFVNAITYVQDLVINMEDYGYSTAIESAPRWAPIDIFTPLFQYALIGIDTTRLVAKIAVNSPFFFWNSGENSFFAREAAVPSPYELFKLEQIFNDIYEFNNATFSYAIGGIYPKYTAGIGNITREVANVYAAYFDYGWQLARRVLIGRNPVNVSFFDDAWDAYPLCSLSVSSAPRSYYSTSTSSSEIPIPVANVLGLPLEFANLWEALYDTAQVFKGDEAYAAICS